MRTKIALILCAVALSGCVDMGRMGWNWSMKEDLFTADHAQTVRCISDEAGRHNLRLEETDPYANGRPRYHLVQNGEEVSQLDMDKFSTDQTIVFAYYGKEDKEIEADILSMYKQCERALN